MTGTVRSGVAAVATLAMVLLPARARAQEESPGPGVVPPPAAYIGEPADSSRGILPRWHLDADGSRTLWIHFSAAPAARPDFWSEVRRAVDEWNRAAGLPVTFRRTDHESTADVRFRWVRRFDVSRAGTTEWKTDGEGWLASAVVTLATEHVDGTPMSDEFLLLVALHELGHVLGLPHSEDPSDVMHPGNRNSRLSGRDVRSAQRLYALADPSGER